MNYVIAVYLFDRAVDWIWFRYVDWCIAGANRENREQRTDDQSQLAAKGPARRMHSLPRTGRAMGPIPAGGRLT